MFSYAPLSRFFGLSGFEAALQCCPAASFPGICGLATQRLACKREDSMLFVLKAVYIYNLCCKNGLKDVGVSDQGIAPGIKPESTGVLLASNPRVPRNSSITACPRNGPWSRTSSCSTKFHLVEVKMQQPTTK